eukprot:TRINITY_DN31646_c0_g1_i4.p2 TRINITY_DN31646_c0_g1~~TRINITY_DN31646_c0_g1_i4.p2  ORF type:complete len:104 (+),score=15.84 TRINITY_DN31646_c0_g1_i4:77-388(+)
MNKSIVLILCVFAINVSQAQRNPSFRIPKDLEDTIGDSFDNIFQQCVQVSMHNSDDDDLEAICGCSRTAPDFEERKQRVARSHCGFIVRTRMRLKNKKNKKGK